MEKQGKICKICWGKERSPPEYRDNIFFGGTPASETYKRQELCYLNCYRNQVFLLYYSKSILTWLKKRGYQNAPFAGALFITQIMTANHGVAPPIYPINIFCVSACVVAGKAVESV